MVREYSAKSQDKPLKKHRLKLASFSFAVHLVVAGSRVGSSEATLLQLLGISPFSYGVKIVQVYDNGQLFTPEFLDIEESTLIEQFMTGVKTIAALSLALNYPTVASVAHSLVNSYKNLLAVSATFVSFPSRYSSRPPSQIAMVTEVTFEGAEKAKAYLA